MDTAQTDLKHHSIGLGPVICPKCGRQGSIRAEIRNYLRSGKFVGPYFRVEHSPEKSKLNARGEDCSVVVYAKGRHTYCWLGRLTDEELDQILKLRPWPLDALTARTLIENRVRQVF